MALNNPELYLKKGYFFDLLRVILLFKKLLLFETFPGLGRWGFSWGEGVQKIEMQKI